MKSVFTCLLLIGYVQFTAYKVAPSTSPGKHVLPVSRNLFVITLDGVRWQEVFEGADPEILFNPSFTTDTSTMRLLYWGQEAAERRKRLMPFLWNVVAQKGQLFGNRRFNNRVNTSNPYALSYPGYSEIFTGVADPAISSNDANANPHSNVLEYLDAMPGLEGSVAAFTSWDRFPFILNRSRSHVVLNSGYENLRIAGEPVAQQLINHVQEDVISNKEQTRHDLLTFLTAKEYIKAKEPRLVFIGLGEMDEAAHDRRYDSYLEKLSQADQLIAALWHFIQTNERYRNNTTLLITTDHGRGKKAGNWSEHGFFTAGASQTWMAVMGPSIEPAGEIKEKGQLYQEQLAQTIAGLLGETFIAEHPVADAVALAGGGRR